MAEAAEPHVPVTPVRAAIAVGIGLAAGMFAVLLPYAVVWVSDALTNSHLPETWIAVSGFNASLTMLFPLIQGFAMGLALGPQRRTTGTTVTLALVLMLIELGASMVIMREGAICLIILSPLVLGMILFGALMGRGLARRNASRMVQASLVPLVMLAVFAEATGPTPNYAAEVTDSVTVNAPPDYVWRYVVQYPENNSAPEYWLWQIGLPHPTQSVAEAPAVGATRLCKFSTGIAFEERIIELEPNRVMTFEVTAQPDHPEVIGHFQFDRGQIRLTANPDGTTTLTATSWYRLFVRPAAYFDWWTADITRQVHFRVLNHMKGLAEADYQRETAL